MSPKKPSNVPETPESLSPLNNSKIIRTLLKNGQPGAVRRKQLYVKVLPYKGNFPSKNSKSLKLFIPMSKGKWLSEKDKAKIEAFREVGKSYREIAALIKRSRTAVEQYLRRCEIPDKKSKTGRPKSLGKRTGKKIIKLARNKIISCKKIRDTLGLKVSVQTVLRILTSPKTLKYRKIRSPSPQITKRLDWLLHLIILPGLTNRKRLYFQMRKSSI